jgi:hypothetical protein
MNNLLELLKLPFVPVGNKQVGNDLVVTPRGKFLKKFLYIYAVGQTIHVAAMILFSSIPPLVIAQFAINGVCLLLAAKTRMPIFLVLSIITGPLAASSLFEYSATLVPITIF